jgi:hypothetical protein
MEENKEAQLTGISKAQTLEEIGDFWDTHSLADYADQVYEVEFEVRASRRHRVTLDPEIFGNIVSQAFRRGVSPETLINMWLAERLQQAH